MTERQSSEELLADTERSAEGEPSATIEELVDWLRHLRETQPADAHDEVYDTKQLLLEAHGRGMIDSGVRKFDARDVAEAFVGSVIFASPLLVEDGIFDIADHLFEVTVAGVPVFLVANVLFVVLMTYALVEWTGRDREDSWQVFGVIPVRVFIILVLSFVVAAILMTVWGRVGGWETPTDAIARISVIWTVGSLGAALGDILAEGDSPEVDAPPTSSALPQSATKALADAAQPAGEEPESVGELSDAALLDALNQQFEMLESAVAADPDRAAVTRIRDQAMQATLDDAVDQTIRKYTSRDVAEAFVGSIFFSIPFLVEDGVFDVADFFLSFRIGIFPVFFLVNTFFVLLMILALVYWAGPQEVVVTRPIFGFIPRRLVGIALVSFLTAAALMTMWGRVGNWQEPVVALARISVVWTVASFGAALGDILPGESSGADINDDIAALGEAAGDMAESNRSRRD